MIEVSVIIPTCDRLDLFKLALESLSTQTACQDSYEVIVVDNSASGNAKDTTALFSGNIKNLKYIHESRPGLHQARHRGMREASSDILAYIDDDSMVVKTWIEGVIESFSDASVAMAGGNDYPEYESAPPEWLDSLWSECAYGRYCGYYSVLDFGNRAGEIDPGYIWGCNFQIRRDILLKAGGFHPDSMPEDILQYRGDGETAISEYVRGAKLRAWFNPKASVWHKVSNSRMKPSYLAKRIFSQGISDSFTSTRALLKRDYTDSDINTLEKLYALVKKRFVSDSLNMEQIDELRRISYVSGICFHIENLCRDKKIMEHLLHADYYHDNSELCPAINNKSFHENLAKIFYEKTLRLNELNRSLASAEDEILFLQERVSTMTEVLENNKSTSVSLLEMHIENIWKYKIIPESQNSGLVFFGAGTHTEWLLELLERKHLRVPDFIIDDNPEISDIKGIKVVKSDSSGIGNIKNIVLSTDIYQKIFMERCRTLYGNLNIIDLYEGLPQGPFFKRLSDCFC